MKQFKQIAIIAVLYAVLGRLALFLALPPGYASPIWPAAGVALAFLLVYGPGVWPGIFAGSFAVNILTSFDGGSHQLIVRSLMVATGIGLGATLQALFGYILIKRTFPEKIWLTSVKDISCFFLFGCIIGCVASPTIGVASLILLHFIPFDGCLTNWLAWWAGDAIGVFVFTPLTLAWISSSESIWKSRRAMLTAPLMIMFLCILVAVFTGKNNQDNYVRSALEYEKIKFKNALEGKVEEILVALDSVNGFFMSSTFVDRREFKTFTSFVIKRLPEIKTVAWVPKVLSSEKSKYIEQARADGYHDFTFKEVDKSINVVEAKDRDIYFPVFYIEPEGNESVLGIDNGSGNARNSATQRSISSQEVRISKPLVLVQDKELGAKSILFTAPVFKDEDPGGPDKPNDPELMGFITVATRIDSFVKEIFRSIPLAGVQLLIKDITGQEELIYQRKEDPDLANKKFDQVLDLHLLGRRWLFVFQPELEFFLKQQTWDLWFSIVGALLFSGLLNFIFLLNTGQNFEITRVVEQKTMELKSSKKFLEEQADEQSKLVNKLKEQGRNMENQRLAMLNVLEDAEKDRIKAETEEKNALALAEKVTNIIETANEAFISIDHEGIIVEWNPRAQKTFGWSRKEVLGRPLHEVIIPQVHRKAHQKGMERFLKTEEGPVLGKLLELTALKKSGEEIPVELTISSQKIEGGYVFNSFLRDISERKKAEEELLQQKADLEKVNLELDSFVYTASHDLRAPLRGISSFSSFLEKGYKGKLDEKGVHYLDRIKNGAARMTQLIDDLLSLSRISRQKNPYEDVNINELITPVVERIEFDIQEHKVDLKIQKNMPTIRCDRIKMAEVFLNLINNGIKFSSKNEKKDPVIEVGYEDKGDEHRFFVKDNGIGIEPQYHEQIFGIFKRLHDNSEYEGTGAGLSIVKRVIDDHNGRIWIESELGKGASFVFTIPKNIEAAKKKIGEMLVEDGLISKEQLAEELGKQKKNKA